MNIGSYHVPRLSPGPVVYWGAMAVLFSNPAEHGMFVAEVILVLVGGALMLVGLA